MQEEQLRRLLEGIRDGSVNIDSGLQRLKSLPFEDVDQIALLDNHRALRCGFPEVVFGQGKTSEQVVKIVRRLAEHNDRVLVTRVTPEMQAAVQAEIQDLTYYPAARLLVLERGTGAVAHRAFRDLADYLRAGDVLVFNDTRVLAARLAARKAGTGGRAEILMLKRLAPLKWEVLVGGKRLPLGRLPGDIRIEREGFALYLPITTSILLSLGLSVALAVLGRLFRR